MSYPPIDVARLVHRLDPPKGYPIRMVLDTDTYNEIDDQFAVVYALLSPEQLSLEAIYAAPFYNARSKSPGDGMQKSYEEILRLLERLPKIPHPPVYHGATRYLGDSKAPEESAASRDLIQRALASPTEEPLYVAAIGAITNIANAILIEPEITRRMVVVWLGGQALHWPSTQEFNFSQDTAAAQILFDCGVPLIRIPCLGVASHLLTTLAELRSHLQDINPIAEYLIAIFENHSPEHFAWAKEIWDISAIAWLLNPDWVPTEIQPSPLLNEEGAWTIDPERHPVRTATYVHRNPIFADLFQKIKHAAAS